MTDDLKLMLGRLEGKMDMVLEGQSVQRETLQTHDERIGKVERWQSKIAGGLALAGFVAGIVVKVLL